MQSTAYFVGLIVSVLFYYERSALCCEEMRVLLGCSPDIEAPCHGYAGGCAQLIENIEEVSAIAVRQNPLAQGPNGEMPLDGWKCEAFPNNSNINHLVVLILIAVALIGVTKFALTKCFTMKTDLLCAPHWRASLAVVGVSLIEAYATYLEVFFQLLSDPASAMDKLFDGGSAGFVKLFMTPIKKTIMPFLMVILGSLLNSSNKGAKMAKMKSRKAVESMTSVKMHSSWTREECTPPSKTRQALESLSTPAVLLSDVKRRIPEDMFGWFVCSLCWIICGWVLVAYGVLIYRNMGAGEERAFIETWGTCFWMDQVGVESLKVVARKAFFIYVLVRFQRACKPRADLLFWYETVIEHAAAVMYLDEAEFAVFQLDDDPDADGADGGDDGGDD